MPLPLEDNFTYFFLRPFEDIVYGPEQYTCIAHSIFFIFTTAIWRSIRVQVESHARRRRDEESKQAKKENNWVKPVVSFNTVLSSFEAIKVIVWCSVHIAHCTRDIACIVDMND